MSEVNGPKFSVNQVNFGFQRNSTETPAEISENNTPQLTDFSDPKLESLGRSQVQSKGADNRNTDMKTILENPEVIEASDKNFETTYKILSDAGIKNSYEEAADFTTGKV